MAYELFCVPFNSSANLTDFDCTCDCIYVTSYPVFEEEVKPYPYERFAVLIAIFAILIVTEYSTRILRDICRMVKSRYEETKRQKVELHPHRN